MSELRTHSIDLMDDLSLEVRDLGIMPYAPAFELQKSLQREVIESRNQSEGSVMYLLLVEHDPPVITISRRKTARQHLIATEKQLQAAGVVVAETDRGGDITYHGPGQLVVYPIIDLNEFGLRLHGYMRLLEQIVIDALAGFGIEGHRDSCATGVWVNEAASAAGRTGVFVDCEASNENTAKICALGVRVSRWVTMHGLALNIIPDMDHFNLIVPCGLTGRHVTSVSQLLSQACPAMEEVKKMLIARFQGALAAQRKVALCESGLCT